MRDYTLAMAAAAAEVPTTMPAGAQAAKSPEELLKEQIRKAQSDATSRQSPGMKPEVPIPRSDPGGNILNGSKIKVVEFPAPDVNGCLGTVRGFDAASGRYSVEVQTHAGEMVPMSLREEYMEVQSREAPMTPAAPPPPLPGNSSQGLQKSAADALRRFGLGGFPPNQPNQGNANRGNWMGGQGGGGMMPNQGPKFGGLQAAASQSLQAIQQQQQQQQMQQAQAGGMGPGMMRPDGMMGGYGGPPGPPGGPMAAQARRPMDAMRARPPDMGNQGQMPMPPQPQGMQAPRPPGPPTAMRPEESSRCAQQMNLNNMNLRRERDDMPKAPFPMPKQSMPMPPPPPKPMPAKPTEMNTTSAPEGRPGQIWVVVKSPHFSHVIVRLSQEVTSRELRRALPGELVTQRGMTETLPNGLVRMPVEPDGWVTVHARNINGPTFLAEAQPDANQARPNRGAREGVPPPPERKVPDFYRPDEDADRPSNAVGVYAKEVLLAVRERIRESNPQAPEEMHGLRSIVVPNLGDRKAGHRKHRERDRVAEAEEDAADGGEAVREGREVERESRGRKASKEDNAAPPGEEKKANCPTQ